MIDMNNKLHELPLSKNKIIKSTLDINLKKKIYKQISKLSLDD